MAYDDQVKERIKSTRDKLSDILNDYWGDKSGDRMIGGLNRVIDELRERIYDIRK